MVSSADAYAVQSEFNIQTNTKNNIEIQTQTNLSAEIGSEMDIELGTEPKTNLETGDNIELETGFETNSETQTNTESRIDSGAETDVESETNSEVETDVESEIGSEINSEIEINTQINDETNTGSEIESTTDSEDETNTTMRPETESSTVIETETNTELEIETEIETETVIETETELELETRTEPETKLDLTEADIKEAEKKLKDKLNQKMESDGFVVSGYIDSGMEAQPLEQVQEASLFSIRNNLPDRYSAVEDGQDTAIKDQGDWGACWSFAAIAPAESIYKKQTGKEVNLSEPHLIDFFYNENIEGPDGGLEGDAVIPLMAEKVNNGGNSMFTTFALARWTGIADEQTHASMVYPSAEQTKATTELNVPQEYAYTDLVHLKNAYWIHKDNADSIKEMIMKYGAVAASYKHDESHCSNYVAGYIGPTVYYNDYNSGGNHAIAIVGWDDNFDKRNFQYTAINQELVGLGITEDKLYMPTRNGAWLIKNSWGKSYGDDGYFWMSYEEASLARTIFAFEYEGADNYDHIYQYDGSVGVRYESDDTITAAAVYQSTGNQIIEAVGIGIKSVETDYEVEIYTDLEDISNPQSGTLSARATGTTVFEGYHTIVFEKYAAVTEGEMFSVVVTLSGGLIPMQRQLSLLQSPIQAKLFFKIGMVGKMRSLRALIESKHIPVMAYLMCHRKTDR